MLRKVILALSLALATPTFFAAPAYAGYTKEELKLEKDEAKYNKAVAKSVAKLVKKWHKEAEKGDPTKEIEKELKDYFQNELADLRDKGVDMKGEDPKPASRDPRYPGKAAPADDDEKKKLEELRDQVIALKGGDLKDKAMGKQLDDYVKTLEKRAERSLERYKKHKSNS